MSPLVPIPVLMEGKERTRILDTKTFCQGPCKQRSHFLEPQGSTVASLTDSMGKVQSGMKVPRSHQFKQKSDSLWFTLGHLDLPSCLKPMALLARGSQVYVVCWQPACRIQTAGSLQLLSCAQTVMLLLFLSVSDASPEEWKNHNARTTNRSITVPILPLPVVLLFSL